LRQTQHTEYIFDRLARAARHRGISLRRASAGSEKKQLRAQELRDQGRRSVALSTRIFLCCVAVALTAWVTQPAFALDPRYPDWPCQQLKVPEISIASVWTGPPIEAVDKEKPIDLKQAELVTRLAARRTSIEDARKMIADYLAGTPEVKQQKAKSLFVALYSTLNAQRDQVMNGIERFSRKQKAMAEDIREKTQKIRELQDKADADQASSEQLTTQLLWQTRIFEDRRKSTTYVCDVPVLIEKRLFDLGRAIQDVLNVDAPTK
jgi:DNA repair exonuclease SbcCD ATPase subunit